VWVFEEWGDDRLFENWMKLTRSEREVNNVGYCGNKHRCTCSEESVKNRIKTRLLFWQFQRISCISNSKPELKD